MTKKLSTILLFIAGLLTVIGCTMRPITDADGSILEAEIFQTTATPVRPTEQANDAAVAEPMSEFVVTPFIHVATPTPSPATPVPQHVWHVVQPGETLARIARHYNVTVDQIVYENNITNPNLIHPGQQLKIRLAPKGQDDLGQTHDGFRQNTQEG